jgi:hypothetical protein
MSRMVVQLRKRPSTKFTIFTILAVMLVSVLAVAPATSVRAVDDQ